MQEMSQARPIKFYDIRVIKKIKALKDRFEQAESSIRDLDYEKLVGDVQRILGFRIESK